MISADVIPLGTALNALYPLAGSNLAPALPEGFVPPEGFSAVGPLTINDSVLVFRKWTFTGYHFASSTEDILYVLGTKNWQEWYRDLQVAPRSIHLADGADETVEFGFDHCFDGTYMPGGKLLADFVSAPSDRRLTIVAHSLGVSMGEIALRYAVAAKRAVRPVFFAPPRTGMESFATSVSAALPADGAVIINDDDLVPLGPVPYGQLSGPSVYRFSSAAFGFSRDPETCHHMETYLAWVSSLRLPKAA